MKSVDALVQLFHRKGLRITPQRRTIFETLAGDDGHPTVDEIFERVCSRMPDLSLTTVYNTVHELVALGELVEVEEMSQTGTRYDTNVGDHHHLFCLSCHAMRDIERDFEGLELSPQERSDYQVVRRQVTFYGYCPECRPE